MQDKMEAMVAVPSAGDVSGGEPARAPHVLVIPFPAQGHFLPMLDFIESLAAAGTGINLTVAVTTANAPLLADLLSRNPAVELLSVPFPSVDPAAVPAGVESVKGLPPTAFAGFIHAFSYLHAPLAAWAKAQPLPVTAIVSDFFCGFGQPLAAELGIKNFAFSPSGVFGTAVLHSLFIRMPEKSSDEEVDTVAFPSLPNAPEFKWKEMSSLYRRLVAGGGDPVSESVKKNFAWNLQSHGFILNSFKALEAAYVEQPLEDLGNKKLWLVGPLARAAGGGVVTMSAADVSSWLDKFSHGSVIYVSFGSQANLGAASAAALAAALEECGAPFVWAVAGGTALPGGFAGGERGLVIRGWAPQVEILNHPAVGWFVTHCGWNSVLEAVVAGVAMLAWPMASDQFVNARLLVDEAGLALPAGGASGVQAALGEAMHGAAGEEVLERARRMAAVASAAVGEGGSSRSDADELVQELWALAAE